ncbi:putative bifunctional diguanylate cyclase/phosphodiesterase [Luteimonas suaedae]|uniref:putative bifunctional diguanylate cyclase/phosphodiesterase n=1 Tax=Luteimonas suaedae TaxID=2605430 RepID=UPI0011ED22CF|nr:bifunctional diguanylate cyclase/phosphodiesterase [Luteimonas suaedae]
MSIMFFVARIHSGAVSQTFLQWLPSGDAGIPPAIALDGGALFALVAAVALGWALAARYAVAGRSGLSAWMSADGLVPPAGAGWPALHDVLTGLPGRMLLEQQIRQRRSGREALLVVGIDGFRLVNEMYGHDLGDGLLRAVAARIRDVVRADDMVARLQGDEFAVFTAFEEPVQAEVMARRLLQSMQKPFRVGGRELHVSVSIGIHVQADPCRRGLLGAALAALRQAKDSGRNRYAMYDASMGASAEELELMVCDLRRAVKEGELFLLYQPKLDLASGRVLGAEALLRWRHPRHGVLGPDKFIPLAEKTGMIGELGAWVLDEACRQMREWRHNGTFEGSVAVNVSAIELALPGFVRTVCTALDRHGVDPEQLVLEITESSAMRNPELTLLTLRRLTALGVCVALDDFGMGHSSLSHLKRFPIGELKVDRSFVCDIERNAEDAAIVAAIITLAKAMGLKVIAEGVETVEQQAALAELGCDAVQGYLIGRPMAPEEVFRVTDEYKDACAF